MVSTVDLDKLQGLLAETNQLPASRRLLNYGLRCLVRDGRDEQEILSLLNAQPIDNQWDWLRQQMKPADLLALTRQLEVQIQTAIDEEIRACGVSLGDLVKYTGNDNLLTKLLAGKALTVKSIQKAQGQLWLTCDVPGGLAQTFNVKKATKLYVQN